MNHKLKQVLKEAHKELELKQKQAHVEKQQKYEREQIQEQQRKEQIKKDLIDSDRIYFLIKEAVLKGVKGTDGILLPYIWDCYPAYLALKEEGFNVSYNYERGYDIENGAWYRYNVIVRW